MTLKRNAMARNAACVLVVLALAGLAGIRAQSAAKKPGAQDLFQKMLKQSLSIKDYHVKFDNTTYNEKTKKDDATVCEFWWMAPDFRKLIVAQGQHKGSVVVFNPDKSKDKVFGKQGGVEIPGGMPKSAKMVEPFFKVGWKDDLLDLKKFTRGGKFTLDGEEKIKGRDAWKITITGAKDEFDKIVIGVDKEKNVLLKHEYYKKGKLMKGTVFYDVQVNTGLKPADFKP